MASTEGWLFISQPEEEPQYHHPNVQKWVAENPGNQNPPPHIKKLMTWVPRVRSPKLRISFALSRDDRPSFPLRLVPRVPIPGG